MRPSLAKLPSSLASNLRRAASGQGGAAQMTWSVSGVIRTGGRLGHSFTVIDPHREPLLTLAFETAAEAERARGILEAELATVQSLATGPNLSRSMAMNDNREPGCPPL